MGALAIAEVLGMSAPTFELDDEMPSDAKHVWGVGFPYTHTEETKAQMSAVKKGFTPPGMAKIRPQLIARNKLGHSEETKDKLRQKAIVRNATIGNGMQGRQHNDDSRAKMSENRKGKATGPRSPEVKARMSEAAKKRWERKRNGN